MHFKTTFWVLMLWFGIFSYQSLSAQDEGQWVKCSGEAAVHNITYEEAQILAKRRARLNAIEQVCGVSLQAETMVSNFILAADFIHSISYGNVVEERNLTWKTENLPPKNSSEPPVILVQVSMEVKVIPIEDKPDPYFKVNLDLNRTVFQAGDEVILKVKASKDCYLTVLNIAANDSVIIMLPNPFNQDGLIRAHTVVEIPAKHLRDAGMQFRVATLPGHKKDSEIVKVIATKQKTAFFDELKQSGGGGHIGTPKMAMTKLARWLSEIPVSERAEASMIYEIHAK
ncbi:DUF4384 domain-containing protein [bacterium]|nr:DUF4384 domain-containing protein [bacterium]